MDKGLNKPLVFKLFRCSSEYTESLPYFFLRKEIGFINHQSDQTMVSKYLTVVFVHYKTRGFQPIVVYWFKQDKNHSNMGFEKKG